MVPFSEECRRFANDFQNVEAHVDEFLAKCRMFADDFQNSVSIDVLKSLRERLKPVSSRLRLGPEQQQARSELVDRMRRILSPSRPVAERNLTKKFLQKNYKLTGGIKLAGSSIQGLDVPSGSDVDLLCRIMLESSAPEPASRTVLKQFASFVREQDGIRSAIRNRVSVEVENTEGFEYDLLPAIVKDGKWKVPSRKNDSAWDDCHLDDEHRSTVVAVNVCLFAVFA
eukprot:ANDGO_06078.mRNA.1 hypothetical protein